MPEGIGYGKKAKGKAKFGKVMREFQEGGLHSGKGGPVVTDPKQAKAIAASEAGISRARKKRGSIATKGKK